MLSEGQIKKFISLFFSPFSRRDSHFKRSLRYSRNFNLSQRQSLHFQVCMSKKPQEKEDLLHLAGIRSPPRPETCIMKLDQHVGSLGLILVLQGNGCDKGRLSASIRGLSDAATGIHTFKRRKLNSLTDATGTNEDYLCTYSHKTGNRDIVVCLRKNRIGGSCTSVFHGYNNHGRRRRLHEALLLFTHRKRVARKRHLRYY